VARLTLQTALSTTTTTATTTARTAIGDVAAPGDDSIPPTFEQLVALYEPRVRRLAHRLLGWAAADAADDIVQDVLLVLLNKLDAFRGDSSLSTWLTRVTINKCRSHQRKRWVRESLFSRHRSTRSSEESSGVDDQPIRDDTNACVRAAVQSLAPRDREVIVLFYLEELSGKEIGRILRISSPAVDTRLHRARQRLKEKLKDLVIE
jgi:RNA polymerase sigma-70 factor, ECF subfamily